MLTEGCKPGATFTELPTALAPGIPPNTKPIEEAIREVAVEAADAPALPRSAIMDVLSLRAPRLQDGACQPEDESTVVGIVSTLRAMDDSYLAVQGPPGTGKTWTASRVIKELVEQHHWRIGVVAQSHAVVENLLAGIVSAGLAPDLVGKSKNDRPDPTWTTIPDTSTARAAFLTAHAATGCVLGGTAWTYAATKLIERRGLDLLVIDEAGQFALAPTIGASIAAKRLLLLGDPQQLPQVSQGTHAEPVDESALGWIINGHKTLPPENGYFLEESWRMHPAVCAKVSTLSYEGRLAAAPHASERSLEGEDPGVEIIEVAHTGNRVDSPEEAARVVDLVRHHLGQTWTTAHGSRPLKAGDVLVVAPYNAQVAMIKERLKAAGLGDVPVGTVDKFQGQEAPVTILSMTASSQGDVPRGMGFLLSRNRINVAISRAQWKAYVLRSPALTSYMPSSAKEVLDLGAFIGLARS
ncbi:DEAD/DEAH box helicase [Nocardioides sp. WG-D5]